MSHYFHKPRPSQVQLYDVGETVVERQLDMLDELLADEQIRGVVRRLASQAKDALALLRFHTIQPERICGPRRETVETSAPYRSALHRPTEDVLWGFAGDDDLATPRFLD